MHRLLNIPGITFALFFAWKVALLVFTAQPVPSNDSFFYDGPVVNYLLHGNYCNPSLANVLPISGAEVFSAYPPLYQAVLLGWMKCFGASELAAMWLHVVLLGVFSLTTLMILRQLNAPPVAINLAGLFLFGITFHDRPDTLAHVLGALAVLATVRGLVWPAAAFLLLTFTTSLQIGGIYSVWLSGLVIGNWWFGKARLPCLPMLAFAAVCFGLIALVKFAQPQWWAGFLEHVSVTPSVTGLRVPRADDLLKIIRTTPGIALVVLGLTVMVVRGAWYARLESSPALLTAVAGTVAALALVGGCLFILTPNTIHIAGYLQPVLVGAFLGYPATSSVGSAVRRPVRWLFVCAALLVSVRAAGMTTWGVLCARDVSRAQALARISTELDALPDGSTVIVSAAYLYESAPRTNATWLHSDWTAPATEAGWESRAIEALQPARLLLTQFDYYRRYQTVVTQLQRERGDVEIRIHNLARTQPPDAIPATRKLIQHISWAPVIVEFDWPTETVNRSSNTSKP